MLRIRQEHGVGALRGEVYVIGGYAMSPTTSVDAYNPTTRMWRSRRQPPDAAAAPQHRRGARSAVHRRVFPGAGDRLAARQRLCLRPRSRSLGREELAAGGDRARRRLRRDHRRQDLSLRRPARRHVRRLRVRLRRRRRQLADAPRHAGAARALRRRRDRRQDLHRRRPHRHDPGLRADVAGVRSREPGLRAAEGRLHPRGGVAAAVLGSKLYIFGGEGNANATEGVFPNVEAYDPATDSWSSLPNLALPRHGLGAR